MVGARTDSCSSFSQARGVRDGRSCRRNRADSASSGNAEPIWTARTHARNAAYRRAGFRENRIEAPRKICQAAALTADRDGRSRCRLAGGTSREAREKIAQCGFWPAITATLRNAIGHQRSMGRQGQRSVPGLWNVARIRRAGHLAAGSSRARGRLRVNGCLTQQRREAG